MIKKLISLVFNRWVMALLGFGAIALLIWFVGPLIAVSDYRLLEPERVRMVLIGFVVFVYVAKLLWNFFKARRANANLMEGLLKQGVQQGAAQNQPGAEEVALLGKRFEEAVGVLKQARLGQEGEKSLNWSLGRFTQQWVYELPWYIFIGAPGSGKTTALVNSGLQFPLADRLGQGAIRGIGGTRNCDWWFTNEAVLLDTAGRYTTQESNQALDSAAWSGFLKLLKKYRGRRPINGVLLTLSVADLLEQNGPQRDAHLNALRKRIEELYKELNIRFPLYVLVTKMDLLEGFMEFFGEFSKEEREQVWGASFAYPEKTPALAVQASVANEFNSLEQRINDRLVEQLQQERDPQKRAQIYVFPQQLHMLRQVVEAFMADLFAPSRFPEKLLLRGLYLTSGTQEGNPIDRVMGSLGRALQLDRKVLPAQRPSGKSFFLTRLLKDIVFQEAGLAGTNLRWERRRVLMQAGVLAIAVLLTCGAIATWSLSYKRNQDYVAAVAAKQSAVASQLRTLSADRSADIVALLPVLESVQRLAEVPGADSVPLSMGFGLYQGDKLAAASRDAYRKVLHDAFMPRLALRIEQQLRTDARNNPELLYEGLKAYIMLHDPQHFNATAVKAYITADWENRLPVEVSVRQRKDLERHLGMLLDDGDTATFAPPLDAQLVAEARNAVAHTPLATRIYNRLKRQGVASTLPEFTIASAAGPSAALVFTRASGKPLTSGVPGLYSFDGYHKAFVSESQHVTGQLADEEGWVLGIQGTSRLNDPAAQARLLNDVRRLYLEDYARTWEAFINDIKLLRAGSLQQSIQLARILSAPDSPLPLLMRAIVKEVTLVQVEETEKSTLDKASDKVKSTREDLLKLFGQQKSVSTASSLSRPESLVDQRFENIRRMVRSQAGAPAPIDTTVALINELYALLTATEAAVRGGNTPPPSDVPNKIKAEGSRMPEPVRSMLLNLSGGGTSQAMGVTRANLSQAMKASISEFCTKAIAGRYPFVKSSTRDVTQEDFIRLFSTGGLIDDFFQKNLAQYVNTSTRPWTFRNMGESSLGNASGALVQFQRAQAIREVFFHSGGQGAAMRLEFKPLAMDATITQFILDVDGQLVKYSHGPQIPAQVQWPGPRGSTQVRLQLSPASAGASGQVFEGPWALFRMFDQVQIETTGQPEKFFATFNVEGRKAQFEVLTSSVQNPFRLRELEQFQCPNQL